MKWLGVVCMLDCCGCMHHVHPGVRTCLMWDWLAWVSQLVVTAPAISAEKSCSRNRPHPPGKQPACRYWLYQASMVTGHPYMGYTHPPVHPPPLSIPFSLPQSVHSQAAGSASPGSTCAHLPYKAPVAGMSHHSSTARRPRTGELPSGSESWERISWDIGQTEI